MRYRRGKPIREADLTDACLTRRNQGQFTQFRPTNEKAAMLPIPIPGAASSHVIPMVRPVHPFGTAMTRESRGIMIHAIAQVFEQIHALQEQLELAKARL